MGSCTNRIARFADEVYAGSQPRVQRPFLEAPRYRMYVDAYDDPTIGGSKSTTMPAVGFGAAALIA